MAVGLAKEGQEDFVFLESPISCLCEMTSVFNFNKHQASSLTPSALLGFRPQISELSVTELLIGNLRFLSVPAFVSVGKLLNSRTFSFALGERNYRRQMRFSLTDMVCSVMISD